MAEKIHIAFLVRAFIPGGAEKMVLQWMQYLSVHHGEEITCSLLVMQPSKSALAKMLPAQQVNYFNVWSIKGIPSFFSMREWFRTNKPDIVHAHLPFSGMMSVLLWVSGITAKRVYTEHSFVNQKKISFWLHGFFYSAHHQIHFVSKAIEQSVGSERKWLWYFNKSTKTIYGGVPVLPLLERSTNKQHFTLGTACIFRKDKQLPEMINMMGVLNRHFGSRLHFLIVGDGPERVAVEKALEKEGLGNSGILTGLVDDLPEYLKQMDFFLMTSRREGMPLALLEAMQQGCIPVVTPVGGITEVPLQKVGLFFEPDRPDILFAFLEKIMALEERERSKLQWQSRQIVIDHFSLEKQIPQLIQMYRQVLEE